MFKARRWMIALVALTCALVPLAAFAQTACDDGPDHAGAVAGLVVDANGEPVAGAFVVLKRPDAPFARHTKTGPKGHFAFKPVPPGPWIVMAGKPGVGKGFAKVLVKPGEVSKVKIELGN